MHVIEKDRLYSNDEVNDMEKVSVVLDHVVMDAVHVNFLILIKVNEKVVCLVFKESFHI